MGLCVHMHVCDSLKVCAHLHVCVCVRVNVCLCVCERRGENMGMDNGRKENDTQL
jgi:hypothetical protein